MALGSTFRTEVFMPETSGAWRLVADTLSTSVPKVSAHFKVCKINKVAIFNGIELIQVACSSLPYILSLYNAFMWKVSVKAGQSELNEARVTNEQTNIGTNKGL